MRDSIALRTAREQERDPYRRRFAYRSWNCTITVLDEYALFARLPEFAGWTKEQHLKAAMTFLEHWREWRRAWASRIALGEKAYGNHGTLISGGFREHWPAVTKDLVREAAIAMSANGEKSLAHWQAAGRRTATWRRLRDEQEAL